LFPILRPSDRSDRRSGQSGLQHWLGAIFEHNFPVRLRFTLDREQEWEPYDRRK